MEMLSYFLSKLFDTSSFPPRWQCGDWTEFHGWLYIGSNFMIWSAYFAIPLILFYFTQKKSGELPFQKLFYLFIAFILFCGFTHLVDAIIFWKPIYRLNAVMLFATGIVSWTTVVGLVNAMPRVLEFKSPTALQRIIDEQTEELRVTNQKLRESEARFKALVDSNPDIIAEFDTELEHTFVNYSLERLTGQPKDFFLGKKPNELSYASEATSTYMNNIAKVFDTGGDRHYEMDSLYDQSLRYYMVANVPLFNLEDKNKVIKVLSVSRDITALKRTEVELKRNYEEVETLSQGLSEKNKQLENFAYIVSHNLRSPLANLNALFDFFKSEENEQEKLMLTKKLDEVIAKLNTTINELTEVVSIQQNTAIPREKLKFKACLNQIRNSLYTQIEESEIEVTTNFEQEPYISYPKVYLDSIL